MAKLSRVWIHHVEGEMPEIRINWDNGYHNTVMIQGNNPLNIVLAFERAVRLIMKAISEDRI